MDSQYALIIYAVLVIVLVLAFTKLGIKHWSAIVLALLICAILLLIISHVSQLSETDSTSAIYSLVIFGTLFIVVIYVITKAWNDRV